MLPLGREAFSFGKAIPLRKLHFTFPRVAISIAVFKEPVLWRLTLFRTTK